MINSLSHCQVLNAHNFLLLRLPKHQAVLRKLHGFIIFSYSLIFDHVPIFLFITDVRHTLNPRQRLYMG